MAEVLLDFDPPVTDAGGKPYAARACGRETDGGRWEGWIEFVPADGSPVLRTDRATTQPNRTDIEYWAGGLTPVYLEGALERTLEPHRPVYEAPTETPAYDGPAPPNGRAATARATAILDPYAVRRSGGEELLRKELAALRAWHLRNVVRAYRLADERTQDLEAFGEPELRELIVSGTRQLAS